MENVIVQVAVINSALVDFSYLLYNSVPQYKKLIQFGFNQTGDVFSYRRLLDKDFYVIVSLSSGKIIAQVFEIETDERYTLLDVTSAQGSFVGELRKQVCQVVEEIHQECFICTDLKNQYVQWLEDELSIIGDNPWEDDKTSAVYRCKNGKWFALVMRIKFNNIGFDSDEHVWVVNLKADAEKTPEIVDKKSIFPAWHMNKKYWITVVLTAVTDFEKLKILTLRSKELVEKK